MPAAGNLLIIAPASFCKVFLDAAGTRWTISEIVWASYFFSLNEGLAGSALSSVPDELGIHVGERAGSTF
jgi:hypothetical protein